LAGQIVRGRARPRPEVLDSKRRPGGRRPAPSSRRPLRNRPRRPQLISEMLKGRAGHRPSKSPRSLSAKKKAARINQPTWRWPRSAFWCTCRTIDHIGVSRQNSHAADNRFALASFLVGESSWELIPGGFIVRTAAWRRLPTKKIREPISNFSARLGTKSRERSEQAAKSPALLHRDLNLVEAAILSRLRQATISLPFWIDSGKREYGQGSSNSSSRFSTQTRQPREAVQQGKRRSFEEFGTSSTSWTRPCAPKGSGLKSGGLISSINHTEALVAIDVNTGKFCRKGSTRLEDHHRQDQPRKR